MWPWSLEIRKNFQEFNQAKSETGFWFCSVNDSIQRPESSVESPESNSGVQSPGTPVCQIENIKKKCSLFLTIIRSQADMHRIYFIEVWECFFQNTLKKMVYFILGRKNNKLISKLEGWEDIMSFLSTRNKKYHFERLQYLQMSLMHTKNYLHLYVWTLFFSIWRIVFVKMS